MEGGYSLLNPVSSSLNFDVPTVSGKEEEEEAAADEKNKQKELQDLMTNAFDDLSDDDDFNSSLFSGGKTQDGSLLDHKSSNQMLKEWWQDNNWIQNKKNENVTEQNKAPRPESSQDINSFVEKHALYKNGIANHTAENGDTPGHVSLTSAVENGENFPSKRESWESNSQLQANGGYGAAGSEELTPSSESRVSISSFGAQSSRSNPGETQVNGNHIGATQFYKPLDDFEYSQYQVQYAGDGPGQECQDWANENADGGETLDLQIQYLNAGMDGMSGEMAQLQILYRARGREIQKLESELEQTKEQFSTDQKAFRQQLTRMKLDNEGLTVALKDCRRTLEDSTQSCAQLQGTVAALETRTQSLEKTKDELINKLQIAESTIETLNHQVDELECSETLARARTQHEMVVVNLQQRHESDMLSLKEKFDSLREELEQKTEEVNGSKEQVNKLSRMLENAQLDRADTINRLTKSLEESQRQCQDLLDSGTIQETCQLHLRAQAAAATTVGSEERIRSLQDEVKGLKLELEMLESACQLGLFPDHSTDTESSGKGPIKKKLDFKTPHIKTPQSKIPLSKSPQTSSSRPHGDGELVSALKYELERSLVCNKEKRNKMAKLQMERQNAVKDFDNAKTKLIEAEKQISTLKEANSELQAKGAEVHRFPSSQRHEAEHLKKQRDHLTKELTSAHEQLAEVEASEAKLREANQRLSQQMAEMVKQCSEDRRQALEQCQQTYLQLHEDSIGKIRQEMTTAHENEIMGMKNALEQLANELDSVKEMYVTVCQEKTEVESRLGQLQTIHEDTRERMKTIESNWLDKLKEAESAKEEALKTATNSVRMEKDSEWQAQLVNLRTEKDKEILLKGTELANASEASKTEALQRLAEEKDSEKQQEMEQLKERWHKEKQGLIKSLQAKLVIEREFLQDKLLDDQKVEMQELEKHYEARISELEERLKAEKEEELLQLAEDKEREKKQCLQQLALKKNKEKWEKMRNLEQEKNTEKQNLLNELEIKKNEELRILEEMKNNEMADIKKAIKSKEKECEEKLQRCKEKMKKDKQMLFNLLQASKGKAIVSEGKEATLQLEKEKRMSLEVLVQQKDEEKDKELKALSEEKDSEMMNALWQLSNHKDREKEEEMKEKEDEFNRQLRELNAQLASKDAELSASEKTLTEKHQLENHEILVKFASRKEQEKSEALKELSKKKRSETEEAMLSLSINKDAELKEALKKLEFQKDLEREAMVKKLLDEKDRQMKEYAKKCDSRMDTAFFKILQDQNSELFKMLKAAREDFDKEKIALQHDHSQALKSLEEENARLLSSQADHENKKQEQEEMAQQVTSLTAQVNQLEAESLMCKTRIRELETTIILKVQELERSEQEHAAALEEHQTTIEELHCRLDDAASGLNAKSRECDELQSEMEYRSTEVTRLQEKYEILIHDLTNKFAEEKMRLQKKEDDLEAAIAELETEIKDRDLKLLNIEEEKADEFGRLQQQLQQALRDKENALNTQNALESGTKTQQEALEEAIQQQLSTKDKLRRYHKYIQCREQQHQELILKLQQEHGTSLRALTIQLEELKKATEVAAEERIHKMENELKKQVAKLESEHKAELDKQVKENAELKNRLQQYEAMCKQLQRDASIDNIAEIQENIKQVVHVLQRDIFQYMEGVNQRATERIQNEVLKERNSIIEGLREQLGISAPRDKLIVIENNPSAKRNVRMMSSSASRVINEKGKEVEEKRTSRKASRDSLRTNMVHHQHHLHTVPKQSETMAESLMALLPTLKELGQRIPELLRAGGGDDAKRTKSSPSVNKSSEEPENNQRGHNIYVAEERSSGFESANTSSSYPSEMLHSRNVKDAVHSSHKVSRGHEATFLKDSQTQFTERPEEMMATTVNNAAQYAASTPTTAETQVSLSKPPVSMHTSSPSRVPTQRKSRRIPSTSSQTSVASQATLKLQNYKTLEKTASANTVSMPREQPIGQSASDTGYKGKEKVSVGSMTQSIPNNINGSLLTADDRIHSKNHLNAVDKNVHMHQAANKLQSNLGFAPGTEESIQFVFGSSASILENMTQPREYNPMPDYLGHVMPLATKNGLTSENAEKTFLPLLTESDNSLGDEYGNAAARQKEPRT